ncbi:MAG: RagB/SusD family nutrient uptake outer membrane protein [Chitinophagaceae bacterium]|nr:RagB/SusD family nutrient uptake outer membrane protein [Chitinophagaceae bacterium]
MKKLAYIFIAGAISITSCKKDFLNLVPETYQSSATFFRNQNDFEQALYGAYQPLRTIATIGIYQDEMRSDNTFFIIYPADRGTYMSVEVLVQFMDDANTSVQPNNPGNRWGTNYTGISRANAIIGRIQNVEMPEDAKKRIIGEAMFLRAFYYFDLVTHFGGVPLHVEEVVSEEASFLERSSAAAVYDQIIADAQVAADNLATVTSFPQSGRASKGAAKMLLAYAYMSKPTRQYDQAEIHLKDIVNMNYDLLDDYADVFSPTNKNNKESIFEVQYQAGDAGQQSDFMWRFIPKTTNPAAILGINGVSIAGGLRSGGWNIPTQELVDSYETDDERLNASIAVAEGVMDGDFFTTETVKDANGYVPPPGKVYYYFIRKYLHPPYTKEWNTNDNWPVYRFSGALLLLAEALVEQGKEGDALPYLNRVRRRAGLADLSVATKENVADEMRHELAFENHRWTDLIRTGMALQVMNAYGQEMKALYPWLIPQAFTDITEKRLVYPIPFRELQINSKLEQNPGY